MCIYKFALKELDWTTAAFLKDKTKYKIDFELQVACDENVRKCPILDLFFNILKKKCQEIPHFGSVFQYF